MRITPARIATALAIVAILAAGALLVNAFVLTPATVARPVAPPSVDALRGRWNYQILLPVTKPQCLVYQPSGTGIVPDSSAINGVALRVTLAPVNASDCTGTIGSDVLISEAPSFESLSGDVTTVTQGRMQFARVAKSTTGGGQEVTLQWRCLSMMCRITATTGGMVTEDELAKLADSFEPIQ